MYAEAQDAAGAVGRYRVRWGRPTPRLSYLSSLRPSLGQLR